MLSSRTFRAVLILVAGSLIVLACESSGGTGTTTTTTAPGSGPDLHHLPLGDGKVTTTATKGWVMRCGIGGGGGGGAGVDGPWIDAAKGTFDKTKKAIVDGDVKWSAHKLTITVSGSTRTIATNDLPDHGTGVYPIASTDDAYAYDRNPNHISAQSIQVKLPAAPTAASTPHCLSPGTIGVTNTGAVIFDALDAQNRDAVAHETQDSCDGHPQMQSLYHYHDITPCLPAATDGTTKLLGYALDGYGIYGPTENGKTLGTADLDTCHGKTSTVTWDGKRVSMYHYVATADFPYTLSCFHGSPVATTTIGA